MPQVDLHHPNNAFDQWIAAVLCGAEPEALKHSDFDYGQIAQLAENHGVAPLLHYQLAKADSACGYPPSLRALLSTASHQNLAFDLLREQDLAQILDQLAAVGIDYLLIKGGGLAYTVYQYSYFRVRCDTDILFPDQATFERAWNLFKDMGFVRSNTLSGEFVGYQYACLRPADKGFQQALDCHIKLNDYVFFADAFAFDELMAHSVAIPQLAGSARTLGPVHSLLVACIHRVATMPHGCADRLIWLFDMYLLGRSLDDVQWAEFLKLATDRSLCGSCDHSLRTAVAYFPLTVPPDVLEALAFTAASEPFKPDRNMKRWQYYWHVFKTVPGVGKKARLLREHFLPSADYLMKKYQTGNKFALPFLYVHRVFAGLKRYF